MSQTDNPISNVVVSINELNISTLVFTMGLGSVAVDMIGVPDWWTQDVCNRVYAAANSPGNPPYNVMVCKEAFANASGLQGIVYAGRALFGLENYCVWAFNNGVFINTGDGGLSNWCFEGNCERSGDQGHTVTFF